MTMKRLLLIALLALEGVLCAHAQDAAYSLLIAQTDALTRDGKYLESLAKAQEAIARDNSRFEGFYFAAYALYKRSLGEEAIPLVDQALAKAPPDRRAEVQKLSDAIRGSIAVRDDLARAKWALDSGLFGRAAEAYAHAWEAAPTRDDLGLQAARLWIRLGDLKAAARVLYTLKSHPNDPQTAVEVEKALKDVGPALDEAYQKRFRESRQYAFKPGDRWPEASSDAAARVRNYIAALEDCVALAPNRSEAAIDLAAVYVPSRDYPRVETWILAANRSGALRPGQVVQDARFAPMFADVRFVTLIRDVFGANAAAEVARIAGEKADTEAKLQAVTSPGDKLQLLMKLSRERPTLVTYADLYNQAVATEKFLPAVFQALQQQINGMGTLRQGKGEIKENWSWGSFDNYYLTEGFRVTYKSWSTPSCKDGWSLSENSMYSGPGYKELESWREVRILYLDGYQDFKVFQDGERLLVDSIVLPASARDQASLLAQRLTDAQRACRALKDYESFSRR